MVRFQLCRYGLRMSGAYTYCELNCGKYASFGGFNDDGNGLMVPAYGFTRLLVALPLSESTVPNGAWSPWLFHEMVFGWSKNMPYPPRREVRPLPKTSQANPRRGPKFE